MKTLTNKLFPGPIAMIQFDHMHVLSTYHQFHPDARPSVKEGLVKTVCAAIEIHAQLEEEIFYPAVREATTDEFIKRSVHEHDELRGFIERLRGMEPTDPDYDQTFAAMIRLVMHHAAEEETVMLPEAERCLPAERLDELGAQMTKRRLELTAPRTGEIAGNMVRALPASTIAMTAGALLSGAALATWLGRRAQRRS